MRDGPVVVTVTMVGPRVSDWMRHRWPPDGIPHHQDAKVAPSLWATMGDPERGELELRVIRGIDAVDSPAAVARRALELVNASTLNLADGCDQIRVDVA